MTSGEFCCSSYRICCPRLPTLLLCWRLSPPERRWQKRVCHTSVSSWKAWLSTYIHLSWILNWIGTDSAMEVEAQASCRALGRQVETYIRRMGQPRVAALDATTAILICQWWGKHQLASVRQLRGSSKLGKKEIRDLNSKMNKNTHI